MVAAQHCLISGVYACEGEGGCSTNSMSSREQPLTTHTMSFLCVRSGASSSFEPCVFAGHRDVIRVVRTRDRSLFTASDDKTLRRWDLATGEHICTFDGHSSPVTCAALRGDFLYSARYDHKKQKAMAGPVTAPKALLLYTFLLVGAPQW